MKASGGKKQKQKTDQTLLLYNHKPDLKPIMGHIRNLADTNRVTIEHIVYRTSAVFEAGRLRRKLHKRRIHPFLRFPHN